MSKIQRIISIQNVGRFRQSAATPNPEFQKYNLVFGPNAYGKSTLCAVLRAVATGECEELIGRTALKAKGPITVQLLTDCGQIVFKGGSWNGTIPVSVFDNAFVQQNVFSGDVVGVDNRRSLYRIIVGREGVALAEEEVRLAEEARAKQAEVKASQQDLEAHSAGMSATVFLKLKADADIDEKIEAQKRLLSSLAASVEIARRSHLAAYPTVELPDEFAATLNATVNSIGDDAEAQITQHFEKHGMHKSGQSWVSRGFEFVAADECPFCGRTELEALPLIATYRALFSDAYQELKTKIAGLYEDSVTGHVGSSARARLSQTYERNRDELDFWKEHCEPPDALAVPGEIIEAMRALDDELKGLIAAKEGAPSVAALPNSRLQLVSGLLTALNARIESANTQIREINSVIDARQAEVGDADIDKARERLTDLERTKKRWMPNGVIACAAYEKIKGEKNVLDQQKKEVRDKLDAHTETVIRPYEQRINELLDVFNAGFRIAATDHSYAGGVASSTYQLRIDGKDVDIGDAKTPISTPSFKNTLSSGDKSTLALAFFLAHLEREPDLTDRIVVFDDPFNSQDAFRRAQTVTEIFTVGEASNQLFVLSHDAQFLRQVWRKCPAADRACAHIDFHHSVGSKIRDFDVELASQGRAAREFEDLLMFRKTGAGELRDIIKKMRVVLETYFRNMYPGCFGRQDNLGAILTKIRDGGPDHPVAAHYKDIDQINNYSVDYHHGEDANGRDEPPLDKSELGGFVNRALTMVNASP